MPRGNRWRPTTTSERFVGARRYCRRAWQQPKRLRGIVISRPRLANSLRNSQSVSRPCRTARAHARPALRQPGEPSAKRRAGFLSRTFVEPGVCRMLRSLPHGAGRTPADAPPPQFVVEWRFMASPFKTPVSCNRNRNYPALDFVHRSRVLSYCEAAGCVADSGRPPACDRFWPPCRPGPVSAGGKAQEPVCGDRLFSRRRLLPKEVWTGHADLTYRFRRQKTSRGCAPPTHIGVVGVGPTWRRCCSTRRRNDVSTSYGTHQLSYGPFGHRLATQP